ncbi:MAG TPA: hypothetical protein VK524_35095, partial [Polyangiaceae bacterium]|nr:hypothetical protein [Polyangiaceae bacterium]
AGANAPSTEAQPAPQAAATIVTSAPAIAAKAAGGAEYPSAARPIAGDSRFPTAPVQTRRRANGHAYAAHLVPSEPPAEAVAEETETQDSEEYRKYLSAMRPENFDSSPRVPEAPAPEAPAD